MKPHTALTANSSFEVIIFLPDATNQSRTPRVVGAKSFGVELTDCLV